MAPAREEMLRRIRAAVADAAGEADAEPSYRLAGTAGLDELVERLAERVADYRAQVEITADPVAAAARVLAGQRVVIAPDLPARLRPPDVELVEDDGLTPAQLDAFDAVLTTCAAACADTGTIAFDGGAGQGRRAVTLVPDVHVCIVGAEQIVETVPELVAALEEAAHAGRPIVLVSGPSATSDIELNRVEGVHGPRTLVALITPPA